MKLIMQEWRQATIKLPCVTDHTGGSIEHSLYSLSVTVFSNRLAVQESPAVADKPARRESMPKIAPIRQGYNVLADNTGLSSFA